MSNIISTIKKASEAYYEGNPIMSDNEFDALVDQAKNLEGYEESVGFGYTPSDRKVNLINPMLSLGKVSNDPDQLDSWMLSIQKEFPNAMFYVEPKWDGLSIQLKFHSGKVVFASTRGNGFIGEDVTEMANHIPDLIQLARSQEDDFVLNGEIVMTKDKFEQLNRDTEKSYNDPRTAAAGILRRLDGADMAKYLSFRLHDSSSEPTDDRSEIIRQVQEMVHDRWTYTAGIDGAVIKVVDRDGIREELGSTRSAPRWAIAYKFEARSRETVLRSIRWTVGRTGRLIPSAYFDPVDFDNSTEWATLHNAEWMESLDLHEGDVVEIVSRGDVIPYFKEVVKSNKDGAPLSIPTVCPLCFGDVQRDGVHLVCTDNCNIEAKLLYFFRAFDAKGIGPGLVSKIIENGLVQQTDSRLTSVIEEALTIPREDIADLPGSGWSTAENYGSVSSSIINNAHLSEWIVSLGIPNIAWSTAEALVDEYKTLDAIINTIKNEYSDLYYIDGFGDSIVNTLRKHIGDLLDLSEIHDNLQVKFAKVEELEIQQDDKWTGKNIVITGTLPNGISRNVAADWLIGRGATIQGSVNGKTDILIAGEKAGSKLTKAQDIGTEIISGEKFVELIQG